MKNDEIYLAVITGLVSGITISIVLGVVGYIAYQKANAAVTAESETPLGAIISKL